MTEQTPAEVLFFAALRIADLAERASYLNQACGADADLRRQVERMLEAHSKVGDFLESPAGADDNATPFYLPPSESEGTVVAGRYKLLEKIGEGGMGVVWMAQQTEPVRRTVALKLVKAGMDTKAVLARFEAERQALAMMDHPNIARVLDAGATSEGRPFFVMELVKGVPITAYCDERRLDLRARLDLFIRVCQAVQHAHQKGVIHRDLKPSNVLVAQYDDQPVPKVIDFGIAKAAGQPLTEKTLVTGFGAVVGTPEYMSPEQAQFNQLDIDTRSDVYSLGVLLYELLTGSTPVSRRELEKAGLMEVLRMIREQEPARPSLRLSGLSTLPQVAAARGTEPKSLPALLRNDLDWIVMKSLEKDRNRRYDFPTGLAADLQRYLSGEAVQAHPPTLNYRLNKFARKHRVGLATAGGFAAVLLISTLLSTCLAIQAKQAQRQAQANADDASLKSKLYRDEAAAHRKARVEAEINSKSLETDLDLAEVEKDPRVGLLRLARPLTVGSDVEAVDTGGKLKAIREFRVMATVAVGQEFTRLIRSIMHEDTDILYYTVSDSNGRLVTVGEDKSARLWDVISGNHIASLSNRSDVIEAGMSPDGQLVFTHHMNGAVRLWTTVDGRPRGETPPRPGRHMVNGSRNENTGELGKLIQGELAMYKEKHYTIISNNSLCTLDVDVDVDVSRAADAVSGTRCTESIVALELWKIPGATLVGRLELPRAEYKYMEFSQDNKWILLRFHDAVNEVGYVIDSANLNVVKKLVFEKSREKLYDFNYSPSGRIFAAAVFGSGQKPGQSKDFFLRIWDTKDWRHVRDTNWQRPKSDLIMNVYLF